MALRIDGAPSKLAISKVSLNDSTPTQIVASRAGRKLLYAFFPSTAIYLGADNTVTQSTGALSGLITWPLATAAELWGISQAGHAGDTVIILETYDEEA